MELNDLKQLWLTKYPDSTHLFDLKRFIRYAIELANIDGELDFAEMESHGISINHIQDYQQQYEFLRVVLEVLDENERQKVLTER